MLLSSCGARGIERVEVPTVVECKVPPFPVPPPPPPIVTTEDGVVLPVKEAAEMGLWIQAVLDWRDIVVSCPGHRSTQ